MAINFQMAYTLDVLAYIDCMLNGKRKKLNEVDVNRFMPMLGTVSDKHMERLAKIEKNCPEFIWHINTMLMANDHLHDWKTEDLLERHKRLVTVFKKTVVYQQSGKDLKKFIGGDYLKAMPLIKIIVSDLERLGFKKFWLEEKLPRLKHRILDYQQLLASFDIFAYINQWTTVDVTPATDGWFMLAYSDDTFKKYSNTYVTTSPHITTEKLFYTMIAYGVNESNFQGFIKTLKPPTALKKTYKQHPSVKTYQNIYHYVSSCFKQALLAHLLTGCGIETDWLHGEELLADDMLRYLTEVKKEATVDVATYIKEMMVYFSK